MAINKGDSACTTGLSARILKAMTGVAPYAADPRLGFSNPLSAAQLDAVKALAWANAQAIADEVAEESNIKDATRAYARASTNAGQLLTGNVNTVVNFEDVEVDTRSAIVTGGGWSYTVQVGHGGVYLVAATVGIAAGAGTGLAELNLVISTGIQLTLNVDQLTTAAGGLSGTTTLTLNAGESFNIRVYLPGFSRNLEPRSDFNHVSIVRLVTNL